MRLWARRRPIPRVCSAALFHCNATRVSNNAFPASTLWFIKVVCTICVRNLKFLETDYFRQHLTPYAASVVICHLNNSLNKVDLAFSFFHYARCSLNLIHLEFTFHLLLKSLCRRGLHGLAKVVFDYMKDDGIPMANSNDLDFVISSFAVAGEIGVAQEILITRAEFCSKQGSMVSPLVYNNFLNILVSRNLVEEAALFFKGHILRLRSLWPETCSFNIVVRGLCFKGMIEEALELFVLMRDFDCYPDIVTFNTLIKGFCRVGNIDRAKELLGEVKLQEGLLPNVVTYTSVISGICKSGRMGMAEALLDEMISDGIRPNSFTYNALIDGFGKMGDMASAHKIYERMVSIGVHPDVVTFSSLIDGCCRYGELEQGMMLLHEMNKRSVTPNLFTFSILIGALCRENRLNEAHVLLKQMSQREDIVPRPFVYNPIVDGFCKSGNVDEANLIVAEMEAKGSIHDKMTYTILIFGHCMKGRLHEAIAIYGKMLSVGCVPDDLASKSLSSCLRKAGMANKANEIEDGVMNSALLGLLP